MASAAWKLRVFMQIADHTHLCSLVERLLDLRRKRDVLDKEFGQLQPVLGHLRRDGIADELTQIIVIRRQIEHRYARRTPRHWRNATR